MRPAFLDTVHIICGTNDISRQLDECTIIFACWSSFPSETTAEAVPYEQGIATLFLVDEHLSKVEPGGIASFFPPVHRSAALRSPPHLRQ